MGELVSNIRIENAQEKYIIEVGTEGGSLVQLMIQKESLDVNIVYKGRRVLKHKGTMKSSWTSQKNREEAQMRQSPSEGEHLRAALEIKEKKDNQKDAWVCLRDELQRRIESE